MRRALLVQLVVILASCGGYPTEPEAGRSAGSRAPAFELPSAQGGRVALGDYQGKKDVLLYFSMGPG
ncbi:MAG: hypothetical protein WD770_10180 [Actinomycetota bacterium]